MGERPRAHWPKSFWSGVAFADTRLGVVAFVQIRFFGLKKFRALSMRKFSS
jgi:hypothetical protein